MFFFYFLHPFKKSFFIPRLQVGGKSFLSLKTSSQDYKSVGKVCCKNKNLKKYVFFQDHTSVSNCLVIKKSLFFLVQDYMLMGKVVFSFVKVIFIDTQNRHEKLALIVTL